MALIEYDLESNYFEKQPGLLVVDQEPNFYGVHYGSEVIYSLVNDLVSTEQAFIDKTNYPDISDNTTDLAVYKIDGTHPAASIGRSIEGTVMEDDWVQSPDKSKAEAAAYEENSIFFIVVDTTDPENCKPVASLRVADCTTGVSETVQYYREINGQYAELPYKLVVTETDLQNGLWDVVGVMTTKEYRGSTSTAWAYHALYKASQENGIHRWISNITDKEYRNLHNLGIPFRIIDGTNKCEMPREGKSPIPFGFYDINVDEIRASMTDVIGNLEQTDKHRDFYGVYAKLSRIALDGKFTIEEIAA